MEVRKEPKRGAGGPDQQDRAVGSVRTCRKGERQPWGGGGSPPRAPEGSENTFHRPVLESLAVAMALLASS